VPLARSCSMIWRKKLLGRGVGASAPGVLAVKFMAQF
jgi:hypothetical protein